MLTPEQKRMRLSGVGGSEVAALLGVHPFLTPIDVYANKCEGREQDLEGNHHIERGNFFERPTADWWAFRRHAKLREVGTIKDEKHPLVICTPDFLGAPDGESELDLSIKSPGPFAQDWGEQGTDEIPPYALIQVQYEMIPLGRLHGITRAEVAAVVRGDLSIYHVPADMELQAMLLEAVERFWRDHVLPKKPPEPDGTEQYASWLQSRFPTSRGPTLDATPEIDATAAALAKIRADIAELEKRERAARNALCAFIGDADGVRGADWRISYKNVKGKVATDWEAVARELCAPDALIQKHTTIKPGYRRFVPTFAGEK